MWPAFVFVGCLTLVFAGIFSWAFRVLPRENWQILACVPNRRDDSGKWAGVNLTWYGFFCASAYAIAVGMVLFLMASIGVAPSVTGVVAVGVLGVGIPASRLLAWLIDGRRYNFTVAGAIFAGTLVAPWMIAAANRWIVETEIPTIPLLAAMSIASVLGEGLGRLGCVSFGCCYGKPLDQCAPWIQRLFKSRNFRFSGGMKKACYEGQFENQPLLPVQAITSVILTLMGLFGVLLFLLGWCQTALLSMVIFSQGWRLASEFFRRDHRGPGKITIYQMMAPATVLYVIGIVVLIPTTAIPAIEILAGLRAMWMPGVLISLQGLWIALFCFMGRSNVTGSELSFHIRREHI